MPKRLNLKISSYHIDDLDAMLYVAWSSIRGTVSDWEGLGEDFKWFAVSQAVENIVMDYIDSSKQLERELLL